MRVFQNASMQHLLRYLAMLRSNCGGGRFQIDALLAVDRAHRTEAVGIDRWGDVPHRAVGHDGQRAGLRAGPLVPRPLTLSNSGSRAPRIVAPPPMIHGLASAPAPRP